MDSGERSTAGWSREELLLAMGIVLLLAANLVLAWRRHLDHDEVYHLHQAWHVAQGHLPYRDVFGTHHPLYWVLLAPLFRLFHAPLTVLLAGRATAWLSCVAVVWLTFRLGRRLMDRRLGLWAALLLAVNPVWQHAGVEMRADMLQTIAFLLAMARVAGGSEGGGFRAAGVLLALSFALLQKAVVCYAAVAAALARTRWGMLWSSPGRVAAEAAWLLAPLGVLLAGFDLLYRMAGAHDAYWDLNWAANQRMWGPYPFPVEVLGDVMRATPLLLPAAFAALFLVRPGPLLDFAIVPGLLLASLLFLLKALFKQYYLPALPLLCMAMAATHGVLLIRLGRVRTTYLALFLLGGLLVPLRYMVALWPSTGFTTGHAALEKMRIVHENCQPGDPVLDFHYEFNIMQPDISFIWMGLEELTGLERVVGHPVRPDLVERIRASKPRFVSSSNLTEREGAFIRAHYVPVGPKGLLVAGTRVASGQGRPAPAELLVGGEYVLMGDPPVENLTLDGKAWPARGRLEPGKYTVAWSAPAGERLLRLRLAGDRTGP